MAKQKIILLVCLVFLLAIVSADFKQQQGDCFNIFEVCDNCSYMNITVLFQNGTAIVENAAMTNLSSQYYYNYTFCETSNRGVYGVLYYYDDGADTYSKTDSFEVTYSGITLSTAQSILYGFFLVVFVFFMISLTFIINILPASNTKDEEGKILSISYLKYARSALWFVEWMLLVGLLYMASNVAFAYMPDELFAQVLFTLYSILFRITPVIVVVWIIWIFVRMFHDKQLQKLLNRGFFPEGKL